MRLIALLLLAASAAHAHPLDPSRLELREVAPGRIAVTWQAASAVAGALVPRLPAECRPDGEAAVVRNARTVVGTWSASCPDASLVGGTVGVDGLDTTGTDALVRIALGDGRVVRGVLRPAASTFTIPDRVAPASVAVDYVVLGVAHILGGVDHLLFVLGLVLLVRERRALLATITAFTLGHSVTLALALLGIVHVPPAPVEALIAASIVVVGVELVHAADGPPPLLVRHPWTMALVFGLLHGLGFAGALSAVGLPQDDIPLALFSFNAGIEVGQLLFVVAVLGVAAAARRRVWPSWARQVPAYAIGTCAAYWVCERVAAMLV